MFYYTEIMMTEKTIQEECRVVGFDMDGVIVDHSRNKVTLAKRFGISLALADTHSEQLPTMMPHALYEDLQNELYGDSEFALSAELMDGAAETLRQLSERGIPFVLISRRRNPENAIALLARRGLWGTSFTTKNAFFVGSPKEKNGVAVREGVTHFFDDERKVLRVMPDVENRFLFDSFRQFEDEQGIKRIFDWGMVRSVLFKDGKGV